jgi:hypothetical protein
MDWYKCYDKSGCKGGMVRVKGFFELGGSLFEVVAVADVPYHVTDRLRNDDPWKGRYWGVRWQDIEWVSMTDVQPSNVRPVVEKVIEINPDSKEHVVCDLTELKGQLLARDRFEDAAMVSKVEKMSKEGLS